MSHHVLLLLLFCLHVATTHRSLDWRDCTEQACYVSDACKNGGNGGTTLLEAVSAADVTNQRDCEFVMFIRPFSAHAWVVQLRLKLSNKLSEKRIRVNQGNGDWWFECIGQADGSIHLKRHEKLDPESLPHADSFHTRNQMYCLFTISTKRLEQDPLHTGKLTVSYKGVGGMEKELTIDAIDSVMSYVSCDGTWVVPQNQGGGPNAAIAPVDATRTRLSCPRGKAWKMMVEINGKRYEARGGRCAKWQNSQGLNSFTYDMDMNNGELWQMNERFYAYCVNEVGCSTCSPPLHLSCPHCAPVRLEPGNGSKCAQLRCPDPGFPDKFNISSRTYLGEPVCGVKTTKKTGEYGRPFGWSIKDVNGKMVEFDAAACVKEVSCHHTSPLRLECADPSQCIKPLPFDFVEGEGMVCPDEFIMRFRSTESDEWAGAHDLLCDARTGQWSAANGPINTVLSRNTTVECIAEADLFLRYGTIAVSIAALLVYGTALIHWIRNRKADAEFDARQRALSKEFRKIKEYPRSPEKSDRSRRSKKVEEKKEPVGAPIVDLRVYPDELTLKRKKKEKKKKSEKETGFIRRREVDDPSDLFCKSEREAGKEGWEKWIAKTGGIVRGKKSRVEVLKLRAEKKAAKEKRLEEQKKAAEEKKKEAAPSILRPAKSKSVQLATDEFLTKKKKEIEDRFITIGPTPPTSPAPVEKREPRKYKMNSAPPIRDDEIKFEPPTESKDASVFKLATSEKRGEEEKMETATEDHKSTDARDKSPTAEDRAIETNTNTKKFSTLQTNKEEGVAIESTEDERKKRKKNSDKTKKKGKSGSSGTRTKLPKTITAVETTVDVDVQRSREDAKAVRSTPVMTSPSPVTPTSANTTGTGDTKRRRRKTRCFESKGEAKGLEQRIARKRKDSGAATLSPRKDEADKRE